MIEKKESNAIPLDDENVVLRRSDKKELANVSLSNLNEVGEKHFLNKNQITNCILEAPQRIKYTLVDGTFTLKAGSVLLVPYGTTDQSSTYPVGSMFINSNFKIYDTQFKDNKFFVWVQTQSDISRNVSSTGDVIERAFFVEITDNTINAIANSQSGATEYTGTSNCLNYRTDTNIVEMYNHGALLTDTVSFPFGRVVDDGTTYQYSSMSHVFNGMGYIGSTVWIDKGVKGLVPNGRNEDGSLVNEEVTTDKLYTLTLANNSVASYLISLELSDGVAIPENHLTLDRLSIVYEQPTMPTSALWKWIDTTNNQIWYKNESNSSAILRKPYKIKNMFWCIVTGTNKTITSFKPKLPFRAADAQDIDGMWTSSFLQFANNLSLDGYNGPGSTTFDLSDYLPKDTNIYEVIGTVVCRPKTNSDTVDVRVWNSSSIPQIPSICAAVGYNGTIKDLGSGNFIIPILADRILELGVANSGANSAGIINIGRLVAYRKVR